MVLAVEMFVALFFLEDFRTVAGCKEEEGEKVCFYFCVCLSVVRFF
jgi:hypothetical protein